MRVLNEPVWIDLFKGKKEEGGRSNAGKILVSIKQM
jgi:hypothetical protein